MKKSSTSESAGKQKPIIFCDFDGTVTREDVTDRILEELADPGWRELEAAWVQGMIGSRECLERQMALVRASSKQLNTLIDAVALDPCFASFYEFTERAGIPFYILSDGFDYVVKRILRRAGADGELRNGKHLFTSSMEVEDSRTRVSFPHDARVCEHGCATCKPAIIRRLRHNHRPVIFIGDGLSDRFAVEESDLVFAKKQLLAHCRKHEIACMPFETFAEIESTFENIFGGREAGASRRAGKKAKNSKLLPLGVRSRISFAD
ncbi:MAG: MtnX-like HAD-IB family phosphatase [Deltaproteobacteria bacterium]